MQNDWGNGQFCCYGLCLCEQGRENAGNVLSALFLMCSYVSPSLWNKNKNHSCYCGSLLCRHRLIFPGRFQPSIVSTDELNYRVRDGNGWTLIAKNTDYLNSTSRFSSSMTLSYHGDPYEIRTRVAGVRGRSLRPLDQRAILMVHHHGLEPWTPWLRVRCSTNWANGA